MSYDTESHIRDWDSTLPLGSEAPSVIDNVLRSIKRSVENDVLNNLVTVTTTYTALAKDSTIFCNSATPFQVTLPTAVGVKGKIYIIKNISTGAVTVDGNLAETISGQTTVILGGTNSEIAIVSDNTNWHLVMDKNVSMVKTLQAADTFPNNTATVSAATSEVYDYNSEFITNLFTCKIAGLYLIESTLKFTANATAATLNIAIYKNGSAANSSNQPVGGGNETPHIASILYLAVADTLSIYVTQTCSPAASRTVVADSDSYMTITKIG